MKPMLAKDADLSKVPWPQFAQPKLDGIRAVVKDGVVLSRTLKPIPNAEIQAALGRAEYEGLDGELIVGAPEAEDAYRRTCSFVMAPNKTGEPWIFHAFDLWNHDGTYRERLDALYGSRAALLAAGQRVQITDCVELAHVDDLDAYEAGLLAEGHEGVILRDPEGRYKFGRSGKTGPLLKLKRFVDFEAEILGIYEEMHNANEAKTNALGRTERSTAQAGKVGKGTLGGLIVRAINGPWEGAEFRCGTGFDRALRQSLWNMWHADSSELQAGDLVKIKAFDIGSKDKPRHPVYVGMRDRIDL